MRRKNAATPVKPQLAVNKIMGRGSSSSANMKLKEEKRRASVLQIPNAVVANRVGKKN